MNIQDKKYWALLFLVIFPLYLTFTFDHSLWNPDETRDAGIARSMFVDKNFVTPKLNGEAFLEKPPLYYWTCSLVYLVSGKITAGTTRLPTALYGFLGILFTFLMGRRFLKGRGGFLAAAILGTAAQYFRMSHLTSMDTALVACLTGAFYFYLMEFDLLFVLFVVLAFYAKGFLAVALAGSVIGLDLILDRNPKRLLRIILLGIPVFLAAVGPWVYGLWKEGGASYLRIFFIENHFRRFASTAADHGDNPFYLYFLSFPADFLPWTFFLIGAAIRFSKNKFSAVFSDRFLKFLLVWFLSIFVLLTLSSSKRSFYLLPAFPAAALMAGAWLEKIFTARNISSWEKGTIWGTTILTSLLSIGVPLGGIFLAEKYLVSLFFLGLAGGGVFFVFKNLRTSFLNRVIPLSLFLVVTVSAAADILFIRLLDQDKSFLPFIDVVKEKKGDALLAGFQLSEMERGVFSFYFEKNIPDLKTGDELRKFFEEKKNEPVFLISNRNNLKNIPPEASARMKELYAFRPDKKSRSYFLWETLP